MLQTIAIFFMPAICSAVMTSALPVAVTKMSERLTASSIVTTSKPSIAACSAQIGSISVTSTRSEEHTSELQSLIRISYAVFCLKKKKKKQTYNTNNSIYHICDY